MARKKKNQQPNSNISTKEITPLNNKQEKVLASEKHLILKGSAGTGKSYIASYMGLKGVLDYKQYSNLIYIRSAVSTRDIGFLPGTDKEKMAVYESPYIDIVSDLCERSDAYHNLKNKSYIDFKNTSFVRGITFRNSFIIVDECQNCSFHELDSIITRLDDDSRIIFCGDTNQADLQKNGFQEFTNLLYNLKNSVDIFNFNTSEIVRSGFVKDYLIQKALHNKE